MSNHKTLKFPALKPKMISCFSWRSNLRVVSCRLALKSHFKTKPILLQLWKTHRSPQIQIKYNLEGSPAPTQHTLQAITDNHPRFRLYAIPTRMYKLEILNHWAFFEKSTCASWRKESSVMTHHANWLVRHDASNPPSWRTMQISPPVWTNLGFRHDAWRCVMTDHTKHIVLSKPGAIWDLPSWRTP